MKLTLNINSGTLGGRIFELEKGFLTIGRGERCNVRFDPVSERISSKEHCYIEAQPDGFYLTDNQSTNGTLLNGEKIQSVRLNSGDQIQFGKNGIQATVLIEKDIDVSQQTYLKKDYPLPAGYQLLPSPDFQQFHNTEVLP